MDAYPAYKLADIWKLTLSQINQLTKQAEKRRSEEYQLLFEGIRIAQHADPKGFTAFIRSLTPVNETQKKKSLTKSGRR